MYFLTFTLLDRKSFYTSTGYKTRTIYNIKNQTFEQCKNFGESQRQRNLVDFADLELLVNFLCNFFTI